MFQRLKALLDRRTAPQFVLRVRYAFEFFAMRLFALVIGFFPIRWNLVTGRLFGRIWWFLISRHRKRAVQQLRDSFGDAYSDAEYRRIARASFEHWAMVYLVELPLTPRIVNLWSWARYVELGNLGPALRELLSPRGAIIVTPHFGNFELMGFTVAQLGLPLSAVMRPLDNDRLNEFLIATRRKSGLTLLMKRGMTQAAQQVLEDRGTLCFIADQNAGRKGYFVDFFGRKASTYKTISLLAIRHNVPVICASAARVGRGFRYRIEVDRIIQPQDWRSRDDAPLWITQEFSRAMEAAIRRHPEQYLWVHRRWKTRPPDESPSCEPRL